MNESDKLLTKINEAVAAANAAEKNVAVAQTELVSRSKTVGLLLLEAKKQHPKVADFESFLKKVRGLKLSRAYDLLRLAGGRTTDEELREEARNRKRKSRDRRKEQKKKRPKPQPLPEPKSKDTKSPLSVTHPHVTESPEVSIEQRRAENAALDANLSIPPFLDRTNEAADATPPSETQAQIDSRLALDDFKIACKMYLPKLTDDDWNKASTFFDSYVMQRKAEAA
jgi:hypothetical protein